MKQHQLKQLPAELRSVALLAIAKASKTGSPAPVVKVIREAFQKEYWSASVNADDFTELALELLIHAAQRGLFRADFAGVMQLISKLEDPT